MALHYRKTKGYKYIVAAEWRCAAPELLGVTVEHPYFTIRSGELVVRPGYAWDGPSGPTLDTKASIPASLPHDVVYQCIRSGLMGAGWRAPADAILWRLLRTAGLEYAHSWRRRAWAEVRALYYFGAVRVFGGWSTRQKSVEDQDRVFIV